jgi:hypothetical protein
MLVRRERLDRFWHTKFPAEAVAGDLLTRLQLGLLTCGREHHGNED